jgi:hypothetical protein
MSQAVDLPFLDGFSSPAVRGGLRRRARQFFRACGALGRPNHFVPHFGTVARLAEYRFVGSSLGNQAFSLLAVAGQNAVKQGFSRHADV